MPSGVWGVAAITAMLAFVLWMVFYGSAARYLRAPAPASTRRHPAVPPIEALAADLEATAYGDAAPRAGHEPRPSRCDALQRTPRRSMPACLALGLPVTLHRPAEPDRTARPNGSGSRPCSRQPACGSRRVE